jgi:hypothetical protein
MGWLALLGLGLAQLGCLSFFLNFFYFVVSFVSFAQNFQIQSKKFLNFSEILNNNLKW